MSEETPPAAEPTPIESKPEAPSGTIREQLLQLVPDDQKSQAADLIRALLEHTPVSSEPSAPKEESPKITERYKHLPFRPRVVREEVKREGANYGSLSDD